MDSKNKIKNKVNTGTILHKVRSAYILKKIFEALEYPKLLQIIKYNKRLQYRINRNVNDYKEYTQIELDIIPINNEKKNTFINISEKDKSYFHIYLNDNKEETEKNYFNNDEYVYKINIKIDPQIKSFNGLFKDCNCIQKINFIKFNRKNITDMSYMFSYCAIISEINFDKFITDNVTNMSAMFFKCKSLSKLNLENFNT